MNASQNKRFKMEHVYDALTDPQVWAFVLIQILNTIPTGGLVRSNILSLLLIASSTNASRSLIPFQGAYVSVPLPDIPMKQPFY